MYDLKIRAMNLSGRMSPQTRAYLTMAMMMINSTDPSCISDELIGQKPALLSFPTGRIWVENMGGVSLVEGGK